MVSTRFVEQSPVALAHMAESIGLGTVLLLTLLPALGSLAGMALAEWRKPSSGVTGGALHMAAGVGLAVAATELLPRAQELVAIWLVAFAFVIGGGVSVAIAGVAQRIRGSKDGAEERGWGAHTAITLDLFTDGLMTGGGAAVAGPLGILLATSQIIGNLPGGFAITAAFRDSRVKLRARLLAALAYLVAPLIGGLVGYVLLNGAGELAKGAVLAVFAGILLTATIEDLLPEADAPDTPRRLSSPAFAVGFAVLLLMSAYIGA